MDHNKSPLKHPPLNGPVHVKFMTMCNVLDITMEAELDALLVNFRIGSAMRMLLTDMVHAQLHTPALTDSTIGDGFSNDNIRQLRSRAIDIRFTGSDTESDKDYF